MDPIVRLDQVTKRYSRKTVLSSVSLDLRPGQTVLLQGANGSGKSTLIQLIGGWIPPTSGRRLIRERQPLRIGYMPDRFPRLKFTSGEYLMHMGQIQGLPKEGLRKTIRELHTLLNLPAADIPLREMSKGMLQKVNFMQAILAEPDLLLLDEPLSGLDAASVPLLIGTLLGLKQREVAIVISAHEPELLQGVADRVIHVANASLAEPFADNRQDHDREGYERQMRILCRLSVTENEIFAPAEPGILDASVHQGLTQLTIHEAHVDRLLLLILQNGGSIIEVSRRGA
ncbi:ATP-binding cassette domain-containing protein [Paenibacillus sp. NFR01]|uniref:ATP-binding cassette domain-containing protein n=1 Tax=Paenibacillus sp. NFR01 TaxID=1566279 RepID=UPI0008C6EE2F|nr:ATP-binding cassette domain-containing protein [Paenibacillus sp. NFR01]SET86797.1 ABC-type multidrug transport system, ATPase component [Paenibacillus sp. NFR01]